MTVIINHARYGMQTEFMSPKAIQEAEKAIQCCGDEFANTKLHAVGAEIHDERGEVVGYRTDVNSGFFCLGDTTRGIWIGWFGYPGEDFDTEAQAQNELTWSELANSDYLDTLWEAYDGGKITEEKLVDFRTWLTNRAKNM